jgi:RHS repeat-associated protein
VGNWKAFSDNVLGNQTRNHNAQNQIAQFNGVSVQWYDSNGNRTTDERGNTYQYDAWNRLTQVVTSSSTLTYRYDALKRRIVESVLQGMLATSRDLYYSKDWQVLEERSLGTVQARNVWSPVYVDAMVLRDGSQRLYVQQDANWNVTGIVGNSGGWMVLERYAYDPYGKATVLDPVTWAVRNPASGTYGTSNFGWVYLHQGGRYTRFDDLSGLYNFRYRDLSPTLGRWLEQDPIGYVAGDNDLYGYVLDGPVNASDAAGLDRLPWKEPKPLGGLLDHQILSHMGGLRASKSTYKCGRFLLMMFTRSRLKSVAATTVISRHETKAKSAKDSVAANAHRQTQDHRSPMTSVLNGIRVEE